MGLLDRVMGAFAGRAPEMPAAKPGRNDACWCGSGKKYKKCHLSEDEKKADAKACTLNCGPA
jgi:hypothetical protein